VPHCSSSRAAISAVRTERLRTDKTLAPLRREGEADHASSYSTSGT
jgi:hypothetical protein